MNVYSLGSWLTLCEALKIPAIPATSIGSILVDDIYRIQDGEPGVTQPTLDWLKSYKTRLQPNTMLRWDCCAPEDVKARLGNGRHKWSPKYHQLMFDDFRLFTILQDCFKPGMFVTVWERPWISAHIHDSYPIEFHVFAQGGKILGISNYYVQRALESTQSIMSYCEQAMTLSATFLETVGDFTADWMATPNGLLFLEGGPPHDLNPLVGSAHPCCFAPGCIEGIALEAQAGALLR